MYYISKYIKNKKGEPLTNLRFNIKILNHLFIIEIKFYFLVNKSLDFIFILCPPLN